MRSSKNVLIAGALVGGFVALVVAGCGSSFFNPAFVNSVGGGVVPQTPGPNADFVLVRVVNSTSQTVEFIVTVDQDVLDLDDQGNPQRDENGNLLTVSKRDTVRLQTAATGDSSESGVVFPCSESRITRIGLGENLLPSDAGVFVGGAGAGGSTGFGVPVGSLNPLLLSEGNFNCGDTVIFQALIQTGTAGGIGLKAYLLPGFEQPSEFSGPNTFVNYQQFLETQVSEGN